MNPNDAAGAQIAAAVFTFFGVAGAACILAAKPQRYPPSVVVLIAARVSLLAAGLTGFEGTWITAPDVSEAFLLAAVASLLAGALFAHAEARTRDKSVRQVVAESEARRREVERLGTTNVRLEDELQQAKVRIEQSSTENEQSRGAREAAALRQRKALEDAQAGEKKHKAIFEGAAEGMALLDRDSLHVVAANPSLVRMTGFETEELGRRALIDLCADGPGKPGKIDLQRAARERVAIHMDLARKDGGVTAAEVTVTVIGSTADAQLLAVLRDVSERKVIDHEAEQQLKALKLTNRELTDRTSRLDEANARLTDLAARKDHFVSTVSHELRTPLTSIASFSEILLNSGEVEPSVRREFLEIIYKESGRLTRLVTNVLDLARIEAGEGQLDLAEFDVREVLADAVASVSGMAVERGVDVRVKAPTAPRMIFGDRDKVQQLAVNLVSNAVKFSPEAGEVQILIRDVEKQPGRVEIMVMDHGPGIPPGDLERIFEKFRRGDDAPASGVPGTGLGLAICREIATLHGGRVWAESILGKGSRFRVELPGADEGRRILVKEPAVRPAPKTVESPRATVTKALPAVGRATSAPKKKPEPELQQATANDAVEWTTTGSLPPLRVAGRQVISEGGGPATGELPPIR